VDQFKLKFW